jgi:predicted phage terminase large subunit-like protein
MNRLDALHKLKEAKIELARIDFWEYCKTDDPEFFNERHSYLRDFARTMQEFSERRIYRLERAGREDNFGWKIARRVEDIPENAEICLRIIINMPPRHGKSRLVVLWESWLLGRDITTKIMCGSYNDDTAGDLSRSVRDKISETSISPWKIIFSDVFPGCRLKVGDSSVGRWALEGRFFNYRATGVGGSATSKGADVLVVDDPIKNADEAFNETIMQKTCSWITDTLLSRMEGLALFALVMTRWPGGDPAEEFLIGENAHLYYVISKPACLDEEKGIMLNSEILAFKTFKERLIDTDESVFMANYQQLIVNPKGALYKVFQTYHHLPTDTEGKPVYDALIFYCDSADGGGDYTTMLCGVEYQKLVYLTGVFYKCVKSEEAIVEIAQMLKDCKIREGRVESNSGGKAFAKDLEKELKRINHTCYVEWFHQSGNKNSRILSNAATVQKSMRYPVDWTVRWRDYAHAMKSYLRVGRNKHDDAPDGTTGLIEYVESRGVILL